VNYLRQESREKALKRFNAWMRKEGLQRGDTYPHWDKAGLPKKVTCEAILRRLGSRGKSNWATVTLVTFLIGGKDEDHFTDDRPSDLPPSSNGFEVHCPTTTFDHRVVVLGQLPERGLHAAVFVQPKAFRADQWWPQNHELQPDPRAGLAFMVAVHLGNPQGQHQEIELPHDYEVLVYAVREQWCDGTTPLSRKSLEARVKELGLLQSKSCTITRNPSFEDVSLTHQGKPARHDHPAVLRVRAPVTISWRGLLEEGRLEIRHAFRDMLCEQRNVKSGVKLVLPGGRKRSKNDIALPSASTYRVRLYPPRRPFFDALYEWWLDIR
jgi:hypothetical protein